MRRLLVCSAVLACLLPIRAAAAPLWEDVPVPPSLSAMADAAGLTASLHRARFSADLVQLVYGSDVHTTDATLAQLRSARRAPATAATEIAFVPVPLTTDLWRRVILRRAVTPDNLLVAIISDRRAAMLCHGLASVDPQTLAFLADHPAMLTDLYDHAAPEFATFGSSLHIRDGRIVAPGGPAAVPLWESVVGQPAASPEKFVRALLTANEGRLAYLYDTVDALDAPHAAFAIGAWMSDGRLRLERFQMLVSAVTHGFREWPVDARPFVRPLSDFALIVTRLNVASTGAPSAPASRAFWNDVFQISDSTPQSSIEAEHGLIDAAYLAEASGVPDMYERGDRSEQLSFAQRVFSDRGVQDKEAASALKAMPRQRMLLLALERMGIRNASTYVAASRAAREATSGDANRAFWTLAQLQGSLALIGRLRGVGTIDEPAAERLVLSLSAVAIKDGRYDGGVARWIDRDLMAALPPGPTAEGRLILGLSGRVSDPSNPRVLWEGQEYSLDFSAQAAKHLRAVRQRQGSYMLDAALDLARLADRPPASVAPGGGRTRAATLAALADTFSPRSKNALSDTMAPGVTAPGPPRERIDRVLGDLQHMDEAREPDRAARAAAQLVETADMVLSETLLSLVYALDIGDPDGTAMLASNVALRHDFGFTLHEGEGRARRPWDVPRQDFLPGLPWHVTGSLLGLDLALAPLSLRHIELDRAAVAPRLRSLEREAFAVNAALIDRTALRETDRAAVVAAIGRGRARVLAIASPADAEQVEDAIRMDGWRRQAIDWTLAHEGADVPGMFSLVELVALGGGAPSANLDAWGLSAYLSNGCLCTRMIAPGGWRIFEGRPQLSFVSFVVSDLNLRVASLLDEMRLPAALEVPVLSAAIQDLIDDAAPGDASDWLSVAQAAQGLTRQRVEDYVAAAAAVDGPLVPVGEATTARHQ